VIGFQLPARFAPYVIWVKTLAVLSGYAYVWLLRPPTAWWPPVFLILTLAAIITSNVILFSQFSGVPERQEKQLLASLVIDLLSIVCLYAMLPEKMAVLIGLILISGFYGFVLPRAGGILVGLLACSVFVFAVSIVSLKEGSAALADKGIQATVIVGLCSLCAVVILVRRMRKIVDMIYTTTDNLARELSEQAIDAELNIESLVERNRETQTLLQVLENVVSVLDWEELFEKIVTSFRNRFQFEKFCIYMMNDESGYLELKKESGGERATGAATSVKPDQGVVGWCYSHGKGVLIDDVKNDPRYTQFNERGKRIRSLACQPLVFRGDRLGVLCLDSERVASFDARAFAFLESLAPLISIAVSNSLSYATAKAESHTDNLTGLHNHRGFVTELRSLLESAYRDEVPLALLIMDIDHFKKFNDAFGHLVGNVILVELANLLKDFFRGSDLIARYGGEEFIVVLNGTPSEIAPRIAEQLRRKVEAHQFPTSLQRDAFKQVTISIGVSSTKDTNLEPEMVRGSRGRSDSDVFMRNVEQLAALLIDNADQALYAAKREGRNQVMLSLQYPVPPPREPLSIPGAPRASEEHLPADV